MMASQPLRAFESTAPPTFSWTNANLSGVVRDDLEVEDSTDDNCHIQKVSIGSYNGEKADICIHYADGWRYGLYSKYVKTSGWTGYTVSSFVIGFSGDSAMYKVNGLPSTQLPVYVAGSNHLVYRTHIPWSTWGYALNIIKDLPSKLRQIRTTNPLPTVEYELRDNAYEYLLEDEHEEWVMMRSVGASKNGKWLSVELRPGGLLLINMDTFEKKWVSKYSPSYGYGMDATIEFAVSDDGRYIAAVGRNVISRIISVGNDCGKVVTTFYQEWRSSGSILTHPCPENEIHPAVNSAYGAAVKDITRPSFNYDGGELTVYATPQWYPGSQLQQKAVSLYAAGYDPKSLVYLALGDSYSSGEGDIGRRVDGSSYYLAGTDKGNENCHLSERSYPYLLRSYYGLDSGRMRSVACSGALAYMDYYADPINYSGQGRRLADKLPSEQERLKGEALEQFIPGRMPQLEFIKKYQPKVVTLTGGGNDVGFAKILEYCASYSWQAVIVDDTCGYAKPHTQLRRMLGSSIRDQYNITKRFVEMIKAISPDTKIYIVGYPSFIAGSTASCAFNSGALNGQERDMINEGVAYMNRVLRQAALATGSYYSDVEQSLHGGRLCEGSEYVTGISDKRFNLTRESLQEIFHPNATGHGQMAKSIMTNGFSLTSNPPLPQSLIEAPDMPDYFQGEAPYTNARQKEMVEGGIIQKGRQVIIGLSKGLSSISSAVRVQLFSEPITLGDFVTTDEGSLSVNMLLPDSVPVGRHLLVLSTTSPSGESIDYYQFIEVQGANPKDVDDDGTPDDQDSCLYVSSWRDEESGRDICIAMESSISESVVKSQDTTVQLTSRGAMENEHSLDEINEKSGEGLYSDGVRMSVPKLIDIISTQSTKTATNEGADNKHWLIVLIFCLVMTTTTLGYVCYTLSRGHIKGV